MKEEKIKILIKEPYKPPYVKEVDNEYDVFKEIVGGYIECVEFPNLKNVDLFVNEEGKLNQLDSNFWLPEYDDCVVGTCYVVGYDYASCDSVSLKDEDIEYCKKYMKAFEIPEGLSLYEDYYTLKPFMDKQYKKFKKQQNQDVEM